MPAQVHAIRLGVCVCVCGLVWVRAWKPVNTCACVCKRAHARQHKRTCR